MCDKVKLKKKMKEDRKKLDAASTRGSGSVCLSVRRSVGPSKTIDITDFDADYSNKYGMDRQMDRRVVGDVD